MSVPVCKRGEQKLEVVTNAEKLMEYILTITKNEKVFKPVYKALTEDIIHCAERIYTCVYVANNTYLNENNINIRRELQTKAHSECNYLLALIALAQSINHLPTKKVKNIRNYIDDHIDQNGLKKKGEKSLIVNWKESDKKRITKLKESNKSN